MEVWTCFFLEKYAFDDLVSNSRQRMRMFSLSQAKLNIKNINIKI